MWRDSGSRRRQVSGWREERKNGWPLPLVSPKKAGRNGDSRSRDTGEKGDGLGESVVRESLKVDLFQRPRRSGSFLRVNHQKTDNDQGESDRRGLRKLSSTAFSRKKPARAAGIVDKTIYKTRRSCQFLDSPLFIRRNPLAKPIQSFRKYQRMATKVPACKATSKERAVHQGIPSTRKTRGKE